MSKEQSENIPSILDLNRDVEPFVIQGSATRTKFFKSKFDDRFAPLQFVHFSDIHAVPELWDRMVEYVNHYSDYISFALHTGDYCGASQAQYVDFYAEGTPCLRPILNCVGNHDTVIREEGIYYKQSKESAYRLLFNHTDGWDVNFLECESSMTYYKDFPQSNLRLIVLDQYYDIELQTEWLTERLDDARQKKLCVITAMHEPTDFINDTYQVTFHSINDYEGLSGRPRHQAFEEPIADFIAKGGSFICNLVGHEHHDLFGLTDAGVLNVAVPSATNWAGWCDGKRVRGTRTYDCFNVVSVDANLGLLKLVRVGDNADHYLRIKRVLCYDYVNKKVIFNG